MPVALAIERVDQCVASSGVSSRVLTTKRSTLSSLIERGTPGRGSFVETVEAELGEATPPLSDRCFIHIQLRRYPAVGHVPLAGQDDPASRRESLGVFWSPSPILQRSLARRR